MQFVTHNETVFHIRDEGPKEGRVVMFANSLGTDLRVWDALVARLPEGLRLVRYDKRGHGLSDETPAPYTMDTLVSDAEAICDALDLTDITFVGLSIGGLIGQGLAVKRPERVKALVLMDTAAKIGSAQMWNDRIAALRAGGIASLKDAVLERWFAPAFFAGHAEELTLWGHMLTRTPLEGYIGCCAAIAGADFTAQTAAFTLPVLAMVGEADGATPPELVQQTADLCGAEFKIIAQAGHLPCVEQPQAVADLLTAFLERTQDV